MKSILLFFLWIDYLWEQYLRARQYERTLATTEPPLELSLSKKSFDKAKTYMLERKRFAFVKDLINILVSTLVIIYEILPIIWEEVSTVSEEDEILQGCLWYLTLTIFMSTLNLPLTLYEIFVLERNSLKSTELLAWEKMKNFIWSQIFITTILSILATVINQGDLIFVGVWVGFCSIIFLVGVTYNLVSPSRFRQLTVLKPGNLRDEIINQASQFQFPLKEIYVEERYKKTSSNPLYFYGTFNEKNIVLYDYLLIKEDGKRYTNEEILSLLTLEFVKWHSNRSLKFILTVETNLMLSFIVFFFFLKNPGVYRTFGFHETRPVLVGIYVVLKYVMVFYSTHLSFCFMYMSRMSVTEGDKFVVKLGKGEALVSALVKLERYNSTFPVYDRLYSLWHHDTPTLLERIDAMKVVEGWKFD